MKAILILWLLLLIPSAYAAVTFRDSCTGAPGTDLADHSPEIGSWTRSGDVGAVKIDPTGTLCVMDTSLEGDYTHDVGDIDHYAQTEYVDDFFYGNSFFMVLRWTDVINYVGIRAKSGGEIDVWERTTAGGWRELNVTKDNLNSGDIVKAEVSGTSLRVYINDVEITDSPLTISASLTGTRVGIYNRSTGRNYETDDWEAGTLVTGPSMVILRRRGRQ